MKKFSINWRKIIYTKGLGLGLGLERSKMGKSFPIIKLGGQILARCYFWPVSQFWCRETLQI